MTERVAKLRQSSLATKPWLSIERARLLTEFYNRQNAPLSIPLMRANALAYIMEHRTIAIGPGELIVGERGPTPKGTPTFPELCCHSMADFAILDSREKISYSVSDEAQRIQREEIIPYWKDAYEAGIFTEFMEQRSPGHTVLGDAIYRKGRASRRSHRG